LARIELSKKLFLVDLETGQETFISGDCDQTKLPKSFQFYDCLINYVQENMSIKKAHFFGLKKSMQQYYLD